MVLDAETVPYVDVTAAEMLAGLSADLRAQGVAFLIAGDVGRVRDVLRRTGADEGAHGLYPDVGTAIAAIDRGGHP